MKQFYTTLCFIVFFAPTLVMAQQGAIKRASLSTAPVTSSSNGYTVQQSIGHMGVMGTTTHDNHTVLRGFLLPQAVVAQQAVAPQAAAVEWTVYPNPFITHINIEFSAAVSGDMYVTLFDVAGQLVFEKTLTAKQKQRIPTGQLAQGEYILYVTVMDQTFSSQLLNYSTQHRTQ